MNHSMFYYFKTLDIVISIIRSITIAVTLMIILMSSANAQISVNMTTHNYTVGGSNYIAYRIGDYANSPHNPGEPVSDGTANNPDTFFDVINRYNENPTIVRQQMTTMCANGQRKIGLMLWFRPFNQVWDVNLPYFGNISNSAGGALREPVSSNLAAVVKIISDLRRDTGAPCFDELQFRFAPKNAANPIGWSAWNEAQYAENWNLMLSTRSIVERNARSSLVRYYDLGAELGGVYGDDPAFLCSGCSGSVSTERYLRTLWQQYYSTFGVSDTYGFSIATAPNRMWKMMRIYDLVGVRPSQWALDVYSNTDFRYALNDLVANAGMSRSILLQETFSESLDFVSGLFESAAASGIKVRTVMQWPLSKTHNDATTTPLGHAHYSSDYPETYVYKPKPRISSGGLGCSDSKCAWLIGYNFGPNCQVGLYRYDWTRLPDPAGITCTTSQVTFIIPGEAYQNGDPGIRVAVTNEFGLWNDPYYISIR